MVACIPNRHKTLSLVLSIRERRLCECIGDLGVQGKTQVLACSPPVAPFPAYCMTFSGLSHSFFTCPFSKFWVLITYWVLGISEVASV